MTLICPNEADGLWNFPPCSLCHWLRQQNVSHPLSDISIVWQHCLFRGHWLVRKHREYIHIHRGFWIENRPTLGNPVAIHLQKNLSMYINEQNSFKQYYEHHTFDKLSPKMTAHCIVFTEYSVASGSIWLNCYLLFQGCILFNIPLMLTPRIMLLLWQMLQSQLYWFLACSAADLLRASRVTLTHLT